MDGRSASGESTGVFPQLPLRVFPTKGALGPPLEFGNVVPTEMLRHPCFLGLAVAAPPVSAAGFARLPPAIVHRGVHAADRARGRSHYGPHACVARCGGAAADRAARRCALSWQTAA